MDKEENLLSQFSKEAYPKQIIQISEKVYHAVGYGHSNAIIIEGEKTIILIDTLDSNVRSQKMMADIHRKINKPVQTIIYTHGHPDHRGGAGTFKDTVKEIIAFSSKRSPLKYTERLNNIFQTRSERQFGYQLTDEEVISQGIGIREGHAVGEGEYEFLAPTTIYHEAEIERIIDGVKIKLVAAPGETDDTGFVWLSEEKILCCGDNYYGCWPNLYAIRGGQYRDIATWIDSLTKMISYEAEAILPGHTLPLIGKERAREVLTNYRDAIHEVLLQTLDLINQGKSLDEVVQQVTLSKEYQNLPYLGEFYGTIEWSVRAIYQGYLGWFDGNPKNLKPISQSTFSKKMLQLIADEERIILALEDALLEKDYQWALELSNLLCYSKENEALGKAWRTKILSAMGELETNANARHYYLACAKENH